MAQMSTVIPTQMRGGNMSTKAIELIVDPAVSAQVLVDLYEGGIDFVLSGDGKAGFCWYLPNPDGPEEQEDWIFHALRHGRAPSLNEAVRQLRDAAIELHPHAQYAKRTKR